MAKPNAGKPKLAAVAAKSDRACSISTGFIGFLFGFVGYGWTSDSFYSAYAFGFRPAVLGPLIKPIFRPSSSSSYSSSSFWLCLIRDSRVSVPVFVRARAHRRLPSSDNGPRPLRRWFAHSVVPLTAGHLHF